MQIIQLEKVENLQTSKETRNGWINYSAFDAMSTHQLHSSLTNKLMVNLLLPIDDYCSEGIDNKYLIVSKPGPPLDPPPPPHSSPLQCPAQQAYHNQSQPLNFQPRHAVTALRKRCLICQQTTL